MEIVSLKTEILHQSLFCSKENENDEANSDIELDFLEDFFIKNHQEIEQSLLIKKQIFQENYSKLYEKMKKEFYIFIRRKFLYFWIFENFDITYEIDLEQKNYLVWKIFISHPRYELNRILYIVIDLTKKKFTFKIYEIEC